MDVPHEQLRILEHKLHIAEEEYRRFAIVECDVDEETAAAKIMQARLSPQKNKRLLQRIHEAYKALMKANSNGQYPLVEKKAPWSQDISEEEQVRHRHTQL